jgi:hypothetical protein
VGALAQARGAPAVMATLWPVADASTGLLMREFCRLRAGENPYESRHERQLWHTGLGETARRL